MKLIRNDSGKLPMMAMIIIVVLVVVIGGGAFAFLKMGKKDDGKVKKEKEELSSWALDEFVVNLADPGELRYLKVNMVLEGTSEAKGGKGGHGEAAGMPEEARTKDVIIGVLTSKHVSELISEDGKTVLKEELKSALNEALDEIEIKHIYFTSFAMQ